MAQPLAMVQRQAAAQTIPPRRPPVNSMASPRIAAPDLTTVPAAETNAATAWEKQMSRQRMLPRMTEICSMTFPTPSQLADSTHDYTKKTYRLRTKNNMETGSNIKRSASTIDMTTIAAIFMHFKGMACRFRSLRFDFKLSCEMAHTRKTNVHANKKARATGASPSAPSRTAAQNPLQKKDPAKTIADRPKNATEIVKTAIFIADAPTI